MNVLVTGGAGFVAGHLARALAVRGHAAVLTDAVSAPSVRVADLTDPDALQELVAETRPDACVHLGAVSFVPDGAADEERLRQINVEGTRNLCAALKGGSPRAKLLFVSTAQVYGAPGHEDGRILDESAELHPSSAYARSKCAAEEIVRASGLAACIVRPANHTGPGQNCRFVVPSFVRQALEIKAGRVNRFVVGNLASVRSFMDVRDVAAAYVQILERGEPGTIYNLDGEERLTMGDLLARIQQLVGLDAPIVVNPAYYRPTDFALRLSTARIRRLGWIPKFTMDETLRAMIL